jgi:hypothetical protein
VTTKKADTPKSTGVINLEAVWASVDLDEHTKPAKIKLLSVHDKVVNFQVDGWKHLLFVAGPNLEAGPASVTLYESDFIFFKRIIAKIKSGTYQKGYLLINNQASETADDENIRLNWRNSFRKSFSLDASKQLNRQLIKQALHDYKLMLADSNSVGSAGILLGLPGGEEYFREQIFENFPPLVEALLQGNRHEFKRCAGRLIGLGRGLTPTGDDLLHGLLLAYRIFINPGGPDESVKADLDTLAVNTNLFGRHMIETGSRGLTPEVFNMFLKTLVEGKADRSLITRIGGIGSNSGYDTAIAIIKIVEMFFV